MLDGALDFVCYHHGMEDGERVWPGREMLEDKRTIQAAMAGT